MRKVLSRGLLRVSEAWARTGLAQQVNIRHANITRIFPELLMII